MENCCVLLYGPPGSGKTTAIRSRTLPIGVSYVSLGDLMRKEIREKTALGQKATLLIEAMSRFPNEFLRELISNTLRDKNRIVLDGYPRSKPELEIFNRIAEELKLRIVGVCVLSISKEEMLQRLALRLTCTNCGLPTSQNTLSCEVCGGQLSSRTDQGSELSISRYDYFTSQTRTVIETISATGITVLEIDGSTPTHQVADELQTALSEIFK